LWDLAELGIPREDVRRGYLDAVYKPSLVLKEIVRGLATPVLAPKTIRRFIEHAVKSRRHWRVAKLNVRSARVGARHAVPARRKAA